MKLPNGRFTDILKEQASLDKLPITPEHRRVGGDHAAEDCVIPPRKRVGPLSGWSTTGIGFGWPILRPYIGVDIDNCRKPRRADCGLGMDDHSHVRFDYSETSPLGRVFIHRRGKHPVVQESG